MMTRWNQLCNLPNVIWMVKGYDALHLLVMDRLVNLLYVMIRYAMEQFGCESLVHRGSVCFVFYEMIIVIKTTFIIEIDTNHAMYYVPSLDHHKQFLLNFTYLKEKSFLKLKFVVNWQILLALRLFYQG